MNKQMGTQLDWRSATLFVVADPQWRQKIIRGGWIVLIPLIGWPIILGYRSKAVFRLIGNQRPLLPDCGGHKRCQEPFIDSGEKFGYS